METFLFDDIIFGPVKSRRLGVSLGINLLPENSKICSFNCVYCECGWTNNAQLKSLQWPSLAEYSKALEDKLARMKAANQPPDVITFAGNGEPTLHPQFVEITIETIRLRNIYFPKAKIAVLSNGSRIGIPKIFAALQKIDDCIIKLDSASAKTIALMNQPFTKFDVAQYVEKIKRFKGNCIIQTLFLRGKIHSQPFDNTTEEEVTNWLRLVKEINPRQVQVYTIERATAFPGLQKVSYETLKNIADRVERMGISAQISA